MKKTVSFKWIDSLLLMAIASLTVLLLWMLLPPMIAAWKNRPRPGAQVAQQHIVEFGNGADAAKVPVNYLLYLPSVYTDQSKWPVVVFLHGVGECGEDLEIVRRVGVPKLIALGQSFNFILVSPQCPANTRWSPELVVKLTEYISRSLSVDRDRVYLTGYSMGGYATWATASYDPSRFAAIVPLCGGGEVEEAGRLKNIPIWAFHGDKDNVVPLKASQTMVDAVKKCGGQVKFTVYSGAGHGVWDVAYRDKQLFEWLLAQQRANKEIR